MITVLMGWLIPCIPGLGSGGSRQPHGLEDAHSGGCWLKDLRHTAISYWIHMGANVKLVTERAGIASVRTAFDTYGHLHPNADRELANRL